MNAIPCPFFLRAGLLLLCCTATLSGQQLANETMTDLNDVIPFGESEVTAMTPLPSGELLLTCGGSRAHLVVVHPTNGTTHIVKSWPDARLAHSLVMHQDRFWLIVGDDPDAIIDETLPAPKERLIGGSWNKGKITLTDLGAPTSGLGLATLAVDADGANLYLVTRPTPVLHQYAVAERTFAPLAALGKAESHERSITWQAPCERITSVPRRLLITATNRVSGFYNGTLFHWSPPPESTDSRKRPGNGLIKTALAVPAASDRRGTEGVRVESFIQTRSGTCYGGTHDGYLFAMAPGLEKIVNLGKPFRQGGIRALAETTDGMLIGICGDPGFRNRIFAFAPAEGYREITMKHNKLEFPYETLSAFILFPDGRICLGGRGRMTAILSAQLPAF